jgi:predicted unusual protein kinase regulating ubiquinone biosynthesis (AarF/ABC1/UbiB family)
LAPQASPISIEDYLNFDELIPALKDGTSRLVRATGGYTTGVAKIYTALLPITELVNRRTHITEAELKVALDTLFDSLADHPFMEQIRAVTARMRQGNLLPNEQSTENLMRFLVEQAMARSANVISIPVEISDEFWKFFNALMAEPELRGLGEVSLDVLRIVLTAYESLLVQILNQLKDLRLANDIKLRDIAGSAKVFRQDLVIFRRQVGALRCIRFFFETDPEDFKAQAEVMAQMVREFGPLFIKMAQIAAANSGFLPDEMSDALSVFQEDVDPMSAAEVEAAFLECFGELPSRRYFGFDASAPLKSGSIASVYLAQKPIGVRKGRPLLHPVVVKVGRHNLEREFLIGKTVIKLAILSSHYWAPHKKLAPFFNSWLDQIDEFVEGFKRELDFEEEAKNQQKFARRAVKFDGWHVPQVYCSSRRIIEMEYVETGASLNQAFAHLSRRKSRAVRRKVARSFMHAVLSHLLIYREFHGDLHPGNVMVTAKYQLYFVDWGNTVDANGIWRPALQYLQAVLSGQVDAVCEALVGMCSDPHMQAECRAELRAIVKKTFDEASVRPLGFDFALALYQEGSDGLIKRVELAVNLGAAISRQGITIKGEYLHLTRSITAMVGSLLGLYEDVPKSDMMQDLAQTLLLFAPQLGANFLTGQRIQLLQRLTKGAPSGIPPVNFVDGMFLEKSCSNV